MTALLLMTLMSALAVGFSTVIVSDQRQRLVDRDRIRAFYGAQSGLEKLTADLRNLFFENVAPAESDILKLAEKKPTIPDMTFSTGGSGVAYGATVIPLKAGETGYGHISTGPYEGLIALKRTYWLDSSAHTTLGGEAHLRRKVETVAIPVFQFGIFSDVDLSFSAADDFDFGGRVHTNGNLFLAQGGDSSATLWLRDRVTAVRQIVRQRLSNGVAIAESGSTRTVKVAMSTNSYRTLAVTEGSVKDGLTPPDPNPNWSTISLSSYNGYIRNGSTGARALNLPLITTGGANADLIRRPAASEGSANPSLLAQRLFSKVSVRILLSDTAADITNLPGVTSTPPVLLDGNWRATPPNNGTAYGPVDAAHPPIARSPGAVNMRANAAVAKPSSGVVTVPVVMPGGIPDYYRYATLTVTKGAATYTVRCGVRESTYFDLCTGTLPSSEVSLSSPTPTVSATVTTENGAVINLGSMALNQPWTSPFRRIRVANTAAFAAGFPPRTFWVQNPASSSVDFLVSCTGHDTVANPHQFTGCNLPNSIAKNADLVTGATTTAGTGTIGGYLKVELQDASKAWHDVTMEILNWGFSAPNQDGKGCGDPTPRAIIRLQRLRDNAEAGSGACSYQATTQSTDHWPNVLFDTREAVFRDAAGGTGVRLGGVIHYIALDVGNLTKWLNGTGDYAGGSGPQALSTNGYSVYFSDRRNNRDASSQETGDYGFEDVVNPNNGAGTPNSKLDPGEDVNGDGQLSTYGQFPSYEGVWKAVPPGSTGTVLDANAVPTTDVRSAFAQVNRAILFRRGLKLVNGGLGQIVEPGFTVVSENPTYIEGNWNASGGFSDTDGHVATAVMADVVTLLSTAWRDFRSFASPYATGGRPRSANTFYRLAVLAGKSPIFARPGNGEGATFGTDGGAHSFLRFLEGSGPGSNTISYRGSLATFFYSRQSVSPFKCCGGIVYDVPTRDFAFDLDFLDPATLPPLTPVFRDINALGVEQEFRPGH